MIIGCLRCQTRFQVPDDRISPQGISVRCSKCRTVFLLMRDGTLSEPTEASSSPNAPKPFSSASLDVVSPPPSLLSSLPSRPAEAPSLFRSTSSPPAFSPPASLPPSAPSASPSAPLFSSQPPLSKPQEQTPSLGPKDSWLEITRQEILSAMQQEKRFAEEPLPSPKKTDPAASTRDPNRDSWFEIPMTSSKLPGVTSPKLSAVTPAKDPNRDSWFGTELSLPPSLLSGAHSPSPNPSSGTLPSLPATSSGSLPTFPTTPSVGSIPSGSLPSFSSPSGSSPKFSPTPSSGSLPPIPPPTKDILSIQPILPAEIEGPSFTQRLEAIENSVLPEIFDTPKRSPSAPLPKDHAAPLTPIQFLLPDRVQERQQFWVLAAPFVFRSFLLLFLTWFFLGLWTALQTRLFSARSFGFSAISQTLFSPESPLVIGSLRLQPVRVKNVSLLVISGQVTNKSSSPQKEPDLQLLRVQPPQALSPPLRCCFLFSSASLLSLRSQRQLTSLYATQASRLSYRRTLEPKEARPFHLVWLAPETSTPMKIQVLLK